VPRLVDRHPERSRVSSPPRHFAGFFSVVATSLPALR